MAAPKFGLVAVIGGMALIIGLAFTRKAKAAPAQLGPATEQERSEDQEADYVALTTYVTKAAQAIQTGNLKSAKSWNHKLKTHPWKTEEFKSAAWTEAGKIDAAIRDLEDYQASQQGAQSGSGPEDDWNVGPVGSSFNDALGPLA